MMDFITKLYQNDNFTLYLTIALVVLVVLFVIVLIFGKKDQKLEETKRLQKIELEGFKEEKKEETKLEVSAPVVEKVNTEDVRVEEVNNTEEKTEEVKVSENVSDNKEDSNEVNVTTFVPEVKEEVVEESKDEPLLADNKEEAKTEIPEINVEDVNLENGLNELENIKNEFDKIELPKVEKEETSVKANPQVFSSVYVDKKETDIPDHNVKEVVTNVSEPKSNGFVSFIDDEEDTMELPTLKGIEKKEEVKEEQPLLGETEKPFSFDNISGETYDIK